VYKEIEKIRIGCTTKPVFVFDGTSKNNTKRCGNKLHKGGSYRFFHREGPYGCLLFSRRRQKM